MSTQPKSILVKRDFSASVSSLTTASSTTSVDVLTTPTYHPFLLPPLPVRIGDPSPRLSSVSSSNSRFPLKSHPSAPPLLTLSTAQWADGETTCPNSTELVYLPEYRNSPFIPQRWAWKQVNIGEFLEKVAVAGGGSTIDDDPDPFASHVSPGPSDSSSRSTPMADPPTRPPTPPSLSTYSSINGKAPPTITPRSTSVSILLETAAGDDGGSSDSEVEDYQRRQQQTVASILGTSVVHDEPSSTLSRTSRHVSLPPLGSGFTQTCESDSNSDCSLRSGTLRCQPNWSASSSGRRSSYIPARTRRKTPHHPPRISFASTWPPKEATIRFKAQVRVTGGIKRYGQKPMPRVTCAADYLKLNLQHANGPRISSEPGPSRQFYLAAPLSNPSSAKSSVASFEYPLNIHSYVPQSVPRRIVRPPLRRPPITPRSKPRRRQNDLVYQRLLEGWDSDESDWSWNESSSDGDEVHTPHLTHSRPAQSIQLAAWRAREDALVLYALVDRWRSEVDSVEAHKLHQAELVARFGTQPSATNSPINSRGTGRRSTG